jgi:hypothetical protein
MENTPVASIDELFLKQTYPDRKWRFKGELSVGEEYVDRVWHDENDCAVVVVVKNGVVADHYEAAGRWL